MKTAITVLIVILLVLFGMIGYRVYGFYVKKQADAAVTAMRKKAPAIVSVAPVRLRDIVNTYDATGSLESPFDIKLSAKVIGRIVDLTLREGDHVKKGQVVVRLDPTQLQAQVQQAAAQLAEAQYNLAQARIRQNPNDVNVYASIKMSEAGVASAKANYDQVCQNIEARLVTAAEAVRKTATQVESAQAQVKNAQAALGSAIANKDDAQAKFDRTEELYKQGYIAAQDVDDARAALAVQQANVEVARGQVATANAGLDAARSDQQTSVEQQEIVKTQTAADKETANAALLQAKASLINMKSNKASIPAYRQSLQALQAQVDSARQALLNAKSQLADTIMQSPVDGWVTNRYMDPGDMATAGTPILAVQYTHQLWITLNIPEDVYVKLHLGQIATVSFDEFPGETFHAKIVQLNPAADPTSRLFQVRVLLDDAGNRFKPGMFAHVSLETNHIRQTVTVPREAVQYDRDQQPYVNVMVPDATDPTKGIAQHHPVIVGAADATDIAVTAKDSALPINLGDQVITISAYSLDKDMLPVRLAPAKGKPGASGKAMTEGAGKMGGEPGAREAQPAMPGKHGKHGAAAPAGNNTSISMPDSSTAPTAATPITKPGARKSHRWQSTGTVTSGG